MSKTLRTAALVVGAVALVATGVGAVGALAAGSTLAGAATAAGAATVGFGISAATLSAVAGGLSAVATLTAKKPSAAATGSPTDFTADPQAFIPYVIGRTGTSGQIVFRRGYDTADKGENDRQAFVVVLSGAGPIKGVERFEVDRATVAFGPGGAAIGAYSGFMWGTYQAGGGPTNAAPGFGGGGTPPGWTAQHKLTGYAAATWTLRFDSKAKLYQNGVPTPLWVVEGVIAYDPRYDSTYPGGNGTHRANDETTWSYSENPFIHALTWIIGRHQNGKRVMGLGAPVEAIDIAAYVEGANVADANGWKVGGVVYSGDGKWVTLKKILQAGMGEPLALGARISCMVNAPKVSLATITTDDLVGEASVTATQPRRDRINTITPRYRLEANNWELLPGAPITVAAHVAEDRGQRSREQDYPLIQNTPQVATAVRYDIENAREFGPIVLPLKTVWIGYKPGDCVTAILPELGLNGQTILLLNRDFDPSTGVPTITARSETTAKHAFALGQTTTPPPTPGVTGPLLVPVPADGAWTIVGTEIVRGETKVPAIVIAGATDSPVAETVVFEYRVVVAGQGADAGWQGAGEEPPTVTGKAITGIRPGAAYEAAVSYRRRGIVGDRRVLGPVQVGDLALDFDYVTGPTRPADNATNSADPDSPFGPDGTIADALAQFAEFDATVAQLQADIDAAIGPVADQLRSDLQAARDRIEAVKAQLEASDAAIRQDIANIEVGDASGAVAEIRDQIAALVTQTDALAGRVSTVETSVGGFDARIANAMTAASNASSAVASLESSVSASFGDVNTRISNEATASVQRDNGIASQVSTLSGSISGAYGEIGREANLRIARDSALTQMIDSQASTIGNLSGSISSVQQTLATQGQAIATLNTSVAASSAPNLLTNGGFTDGTNNWYLYQTNGNWDIGRNSSGYNFAQHYFTNYQDTGFFQNVYNIEPGARYSLSMEQEHDGGCYGHCTIQWWTEGFGSFIGYGGETPENVSGWGNRANLNGSTAPGNARCARIQFYPSAGNGIRRIARVMFQRSVVASGYTDAAALDSLGRAVASVQARVDTVQSALVDTQGRTQAYLKQGVIAGDGRASIEIFASDGNGQPVGKIKLSGDVLIDGNTILNGSLTFTKAAYGLTGVDSLYYYQTFNDNAQTDWSAGPAGLGITISEGSTVDGRANIAMTNLNGVGRVFVRVQRVNDGTVVWGGQNGIQFNPPGGGDHMMLHIEFADSVPAGMTPQYDIRFRCTGGANIRSSVRVEKLSERVRTRFSQIWIAAPANEGPGAGSNGGGQINGDDSGSGGVTGTNPSGGNVNRGGLRGRTAEV